MRSVPLSRLNGVTKIFRARTEIEKIAVARGRHRIHLIDLDIGGSSREKETTRSDVRRPINERRVAQRGKDEGVKEKGVRSGERWRRRRRRRRKRWMRMRRGRRDRMRWRKRWRRRTVGRTDGRTDGWTDGSRGEKRAKSIDTSSRVRGEAHFAHRAQTTHRGEANPCAPLPLEPVTRTINFHLLPSRLGLSRKDVRVVQRERVRERERETEREREKEKEV